jgi:hypothetical protein
VGTLGWYPQVMWSNSNIGAWEDVEDVVMDEDTGSVRRGSIKMDIKSFIGSIVLRLSLSANSFWTIRRQRES